MVIIIADDIFLRVMKQRFEFLLFFLYFYYWLYILFNFGLHSFSQNYAPTNNRYGSLVDDHNLDD